MHILLSIVLVMAELAFGTLLIGAFLYASFYGYYIAACHSDVAGLALIAMIGALVTTPYVGGLYVIAVVSIVMARPFHFGSKFWLIGKWTPIILLSIGIITWKVSKIVDAHTLCSILF